METVHLDLQKYLQKNIFPSRTVLVFPPFNGFRRFLIHKLIEDNFASSEVAAFSIGQDTSRRIVVCYKGLIREGQTKGPPSSSLQTAKFNMIEKEKQNRQRSSPAAPVYRPPAARIAESRKNTENTRSSDSKQCRVRRPDQQMYVPRPKRASYGCEEPRSRSRSSSRASLESECYEKKEKCSSLKTSKTVVPEPIKISKDCVCESERNSSDRLQNSIKEESNSSKDSFDISSTIAPVERIPLPSVERSTDISFENLVTDDSNQSITDSSKCITSEQNKMFDMSESVSEETTEVTVQSLKPNSHTSTVRNSDSTEKKTKPEVEKMETISISSDSRCENSSNSSSSSTSSSSDSFKTTESSSEADSKSAPKHNTSEKMDVDPKEDELSNNIKCSQNQDIHSTTSVPDVLVISDSSSEDSTSRHKEVKTIPETTKRKEKLQSSSKENIEDTKPSKKTVDPHECDWEALYDESGECLVPSLMEELANSVGRVKVTSVDSDYRPYQSIEERTNDGECIIEIYDFPAEFKTTDLYNIFAAYRSKNFQIKWVDDTHALGVFPSPLMADEVLACTLPFVKTRPLRFGIIESRNKARNLVLPALPSMERPKTCTALARRLVTGALGLRIPTSSQEREREKQVLKEAREKRRLEAKQKEAAWDGSITSSSCI